MLSNRASSILTTVLISIASTLLTAVLIFAGNAAFAQKTNTAPTDDEAALRIASYTPPTGSTLCSAYFIESLTHSNTYQQSDWDAMFKQSIGYGGTSYLPMDEMIDLNGDGLVDYIYSHQYSEIQPTTGTPAVYGYDCVYLNTGSGFEAVHRCSMTIEYDVTGAISSQDYYGDCAG